MHIHTHTDEIGDNSDKSLDGDGETTFFLPQELQQLRLQRSSEAKRHVAEESPAVSLGWS